MPDLENIDVIRGTFPEIDFEGQKIASEIEVDLESRRSRTDNIQNEENFRSLLNTNTRLNRKSTAKTTQLNSSQMSRNVEEVRKDVKTYILEVNISAIEGKALPTIQNAINVLGADSETKLYPNQNSESSRKSRVHFPELNSARNNCQIHTRESSVDSFEIDDGYDTYCFQ